MNNMGQINGGWNEQHRDLQTTVSSSYRCRAQSVSWPGPTAALITSMCASPFGSVSGLLVIFGLFSAPQHIFHLSHTADVVQNSPCMFSIQFVVSFSCFLLGFFFSVTARVWSFSSSSSAVAVCHTVSVAMEPALCSHGNGPGRLRPFSGSYLETLKRIVGCARVDGFFSRTNLYTELRHENTNI